MRRFFIYINVLIVIILISNLFFDRQPALQFRKTPIVTTIYLDRDFDLEEKAVIYNAALEWNSATNGIVQFDVVELPTMQEMIPGHSLLVVRVSPDYPDIIQLDQMTGNHTLGYYSGDLYLPYIELVSNRLDEGNYHQTVMHELGHALGLKHNSGEDGLNTLMYPTSEYGSSSITPLDGQQFCEIYQCNPNLLRYKQEVFHF